MTSWEEYTARMAGAWPGVLFRMREMMYDALAEQGTHYAGDIRRIVEVICDQWRHVCNLTAGGFP